MYWKTSSGASVGCVVSDRAAIINACPYLSELRDFLGFDRNAGGLTWSMTPEGHEAWAVVASALGSTHRRMGSVDDRPDPSTSTTYRRRLVAHLLFHTLSSGSMLKDRDLWNTIYTFYHRIPERGTVARPVPLDYPHDPAIPSTTPTSSTKKDGYFPRMEFWGGGE